MCNFNVGSIRFYDNNSLSIGSEESLSLFIDNSNPDSVAILSIGVSLMIIAACFQLTDGLQAVGLGLLRGMQDVKVPFIIALVSYWELGLRLAIF